MNTAQQISRRLGRSTGAQTRSAADYYINATMSMKSDPFISESAALLAKYQEEVKKFNRHCTPTPSTYDSLVIGGRLGGYKYYDMDQAMAAALEMPIEANSARQMNKML